MKHHGSFEIKKLKVWWDLTYWSTSWPNRGETGWCWHIGPFLIDWDYADWYSN